MVKMTDESPSVDVRELHAITPAEALALVDEHLGDPASWPSALMEYRLTAEFQSDWKEEVGHWLHCAKTHGFLDRLLAPINGEKRRGMNTGEISANDKRHLKLHQYLAPAFACHYLTGTGWTFDGYDTDVGGGVDVDVAMVSPDGGLTELQVKAPDQPGEVVAGRIHDGEFDGRIVKQLDHAVKQLPSPARSVGLVFLHAQRRRPIVSDCAFIVHHLVGSTLQHSSLQRVVLPRENAGKFFTQGWGHIAAVVAVDFLRGELEAKYASTVFLNPNATRPADPDWFLRASVLALRGDRFEWVRGEPGHHDLPSGTQLVDRLPWG